MGLLSLQELRDPQRIHNALATGSYFFAPYLPTDATGGGTAGIAPGLNSTGGTAGRAMLNASLAPALAAGSSSSGFVPALPFPSGIPSNLSQIPNNILGYRFFNPDGSLKPSSELLTWEVDVPVQFTLLPLFVPGTESLRPNSVHRFGVTSYGGVQVKSVDNTYMKPHGANTLYGEWVVYTAVNSKGELVTGRSDIATNLFFFWEPDFGLGTVTLVPQANQRLSGEAQLSGGLSGGSSGGLSGGLLGAGSIPPSANDPEWSSSPAPQPGAPGSQPLPPGVEMQPLPKGGTAPVKPSPIDPSGSQDPNNPQGSGNPLNPEDGPIFPPEGNGNGGGGDPPYKKPISEMSLIEAFWTAISRAPGVIASDLKKVAQELLRNPDLQLFLKLMLIITVAFPEADLVLLGLAIVEGGMLGLGIADFIRGVVHVFQAKSSNSDALLDQATHDFAHALENLGPLMLTKLSGLVKGFEVVKGKLTGIPWLGRLLMVLDTLGLDFIWQAFRAGDIGQIWPFADRLATLSAEARAAFGAAFKKFPAARAKVLEAGPEAIDSLNGLANRFKADPEILANLLGKEEMSLNKLTEVLALKRMTPELLQKLLDRQKMTVEEIIQALSSCFVAGTKVLTPKGKKNIEDVQVGDWVVAAEPSTDGEIKNCKVLKIFTRETKTLIDIYVGDKIISTTEEHPFWVMEEGWVKAKDLKVGVFLQTSTKKVVPISRIERQEEKVAVYNFEVENFHTYFVSDLEILVHNNCVDHLFPCNPSQIQHIFGNRAGHLPDTPANRALLKQVADDPSTTLGLDQYGNTWSAAIQPNGSQIWVRTRNGIISNGGVNDVPRGYNPDTGLNNLQP